MDPQQIKNNDAQVGMHTWCTVITVNIQRLYTIGMTHTHSWIQFRFQIASRLWFHYSGEGDLAAGRAEYGWALSTNIVPFILFEFEMSRLGLTGPISAKFDVVSEPSVVVDC